MRNVNQVRPQSGRKTQIYQVGDNRDARGRGKKIAAHDGRHVVLVVVDITQEENPAGTSSVLVAESSSPASVYYGAAAGGKQHPGTHMPCWPVSFLAASSRWMSMMVTDELPGNSKAGILQRRALAQQAAAPP